MKMTSPLLFFSLLSSSLHFSFLLFRLPHVGYIKMIRLYTTGT